MATEKLRTRFNFRAKCELARSCHRLTVAQAIACPRPREFFHPADRAVAPSAYLAEAVSPSPEVSRSISAALMRPWALEWPVNFTHKRSMMM